MQSPRCTQKQKDVILILWYGFRNNVEPTVQSLANVEKCLEQNCYNYYVTE